MRSADETPAAKAQNRAAEPLACASGRTSPVSITQAAMETAEPDRPLRRGWTTGTCAAAATRAAYQALLTGVFPDPVSVLLPGGERPAFALATSRLGDGWAQAGVVKDAGDDPDVTHGALIVSTVRLGEPGIGVAFRAGEGVGTVTRAGLPLAPGEPAINPVPREMIRTAIAEAASLHGGAGDAVVELSIPGGEKIAEKTLNGRLGIIGGLSILGTTGVVVPFSCSAWIHSIHRGIDVARAAGLEHVAGATGSTSEAAVAALYGLPETALIDMGDFVGGMLKYLRHHPVPRVTVAGGMAKMTKLGQGLLDLHSRRGEVNLHWLSRAAIDMGGETGLAARIAQSNSALEAFGHARAAGVDLPGGVAGCAWHTAAAALGPGMRLEVVVFDRSGGLLARTGFRDSGP
jgi:cobalt-precorrin-5B (C1)-methyltransferase